MKISQSIIHVKEYLYMFFSTLKDILQTLYKHKVKQILKLAKTLLWLFA